MERAGLPASESSALRLLARGTGSALRLAGGGDPAAGFAYDFLSGMLGEQVQREVDEHVAQTQAPAQTGMTAAHAGVGYAGPAAAALPAPVAVTVAPGETLEGLARRLYGDQWRAGMTLMAADNGLSANQWGSPLIRAGQTRKLGSESNEAQSRMKPQIRRHMGLQKT